jgi:hypothetical protein
MEARMKQKWVKKDSDSKGQSDISGNSGYGCRTLGFGFTAEIPLSGAAEKYCKIGLGVVHSANISLWGLLCVSTNSFMSHRNSQAKLYRERAKLTRI